MTSPRIAFSLSLPLCLAVAACGSARQPDPTPQPSESPARTPATPKADATESIFSPEAGVATAAPRLETLVKVISFAQGGAELDDTARAALDAILQSDQIKSDLPIVLRGHSDMGGSNEANMRVSQSRAEAVRDYLLGHDVAEERIILIAFGGQNPVKPNALPNGDPDEAGRAANRRVEVVIPAGMDGDEAQNMPTPTLIEKVVEAAEKKP